VIVGRLFEDVHVRRFSGIHHFFPPEQIYTPDHVRALTDLWPQAGVAIPAQASELRLR
jgi:hypothetical protein